MKFNLFAQARGNCKVGVRSTEDSTMFIHTVTTTAIHRHGKGLANGIAPVVFSSVDFDA